MHPVKRWLDYPTSTAVLQQIGKEKRWAVVDGTSGQPMLIRHPVVKDKYVVYLFDTCESAALALDSLGEGRLAEVTVQSVVDSLAGAEGTADVADVTGAAGSGAGASVGNAAQTAHAADASVTAAATVGAQATIAREVIALFLMNGGRIEEIYFDNLPEMPDGYFKPGEHFTAQFENVVTRGFASGRPAFVRDDSLKPPGDETGDRLFVYSHKGVAVSGVETRHYETEWGDSLIPMESVGGVAAALEARRGGYTKRLLQMTMDDLRQRLVPLSTITTPFSYAFYRSAGWEYAFQRKRYSFSPSLLKKLRRPEDWRAEDWRSETLPPEDWQPGGWHPDDLRSATRGRETPANETLSVERDTPSRTTETRSRDGQARYYAYDGATKAMPIPVAEAYLKSLRSRYQGYARRTAQQWYHRLRGDKVYTYIWETEAGPEGYVVVSFQDDFHENGVLLKEMFATNDDALLGLLSMLASLDSQTETITWDAPEDTRLDLWIEEQDNLQTSLQPEGMFRIVEVGGAVEARSVGADVEGRINLHLADTLTPWNDGVWTMEFADGRVRAAKLKAPVAANAMDIRTFGLLYAGSIDAAEAVRYYGAALGQDERILLDRAFGGRKPLLYEWF